MVFWIGNKFCGFGNVWKWLWYLFDGSIRLMVFCGLSRFLRFNGGWWYVTLRKFVYLDNFFFFLWRLGDQLSISLKWFSYVITVFGLQVYVEGFCIFLIYFPLHTILLHPNGNLSMLLFLLPCCCSVCILIPA